MNKYVLNQKVFCCFCEELQFLCPICLKNETFEGKFDLFFGKIKEIRITEEDGKTVFKYIIEGTENISYLAREDFVFLTLQEAKEKYKKLTNKGE